jgi:hypothetical protein
VSECLLYPQVLEVFLLEFPVEEPHLHLLHEATDALGLEHHHLLPLQVLLPVLLHHCQQEVAHHPALVEQGLLVALDDAPAELVERLRVADDGEVLVGGAGGELVGLQVDCVLVDVALDALVVLAQQPNHLALLLAVHEAEDGRLALPHLAQELLLAADLIFQRGHRLLVLCALILQVAEVSFPFGYDLGDGLLAGD